MPRPRQHSQRHYPRAARVNELCREIVADELERIGDERLELLTVTHVDVETDMLHAMVEYSALGREAEMGEALSEHRIRLQSAIARQARLKRTPELAFRPDQVILHAARIEELLAHQPPYSPPAEPDGAG